MTASCHPGILGIKFSKVIHAIDLHSCGEPGRVIVGGVLDVPGASMFEKMQYLATEADACITRVDHPDMPGHFTFLVEQLGEPVVLITVHVDHVLEEVEKIAARPGLIGEAIRRAARTVFIDAHMVAPLKRALARTA